MFSNGTEFEAWSEAWCGSCKKDFESCKVIDDLFILGYSESLAKGPLWSPATVAYCTEYERK